MYLWKMVFQKYLSTLLFLVAVLLQFTVTGQEYQFTSTNKKALKFYKIGEGAFKIRENLTAESALEKSTKADKNFIEAWLLLGDVYTELNDVEKAIKAYESAILLDSLFFPRAYHFIGNLQFEKGDYLEAANNYNNYQKLIPTGSTIAKSVTKSLEKARFAQKAVANPLAVELKNMGKEVNSASDDYVNYVSADALELVMTRKEAVGIDEFKKINYSEFFYHSINENGSWQKPDTIKMAWSKGVNLGGMNMSVEDRKSVV